MDEQAPDKTLAPEPAPDSVANESNLDAAKQTPDEPDEDTKSRDFKAELRDAFAETKKNPASLWKKPETLLPGKNLAVAGLAASVVLLLLLLVTSSSFLGFVCLVLGLGALLFSALGLKTEGRKLAVGGSVVGLLVVLCALGQTFGSSGSDSDDSSSSSNVSKSSDGVPSEADLQPLVANDGTASSGIEEILSKAENAKRIGSLNFHGFYTGMSLVDAKALAAHYGVEDNNAAFFSNKENGEVYLIHLSPSALYKIAEFPNDYEQAVIDMMAEVGSANWFENTMVGSHSYRTADGVVVSMNGIAWLGGSNKAFYIEDSKRARSAKEFNSMFRNNNDARKAALDLKQKGVNIRLFTLPGNVELLMKEVPGMNLWKSEFPLTDAQCNAMQSQKNAGAADGKLIAGLNALPAVQAAGFVFLSPQPVEFQGDRQEKLETSFVDYWLETKESSPETTWEGFVEQCRKDREAAALSLETPSKERAASIAKGLIVKKGNLVAETRNLADDPTAKEPPLAE